MLGAMRVTSSLLHGEEKSNSGKYKENKEIKRELQGGRLSDFALA